MGYSATGPTVARGSGTGESGEEDTRNTQVQAESGPGFHLPLFSFIPKRYQ